METYTDQFLDSDKFKANSYHRVTSESRDSHCRMKLIKKFGFRISEKSFIIGISKGMSLEAFFSFAKLYIFTFIQEIKLFLQIQS